MQRSKRMETRKSSSLSGKKGIILDRRNNTFNAILSFNNKRTGGSITIHLGNFDTIDEAYNYRKEYLLKLID